MSSSPGDAAASPNRSIRVTLFVFMFVHLYVHVEQDHLHSDSLAKEAARFDLLSGVLPKIARREEPFSCSEPLPSVFLQVPTAVGCISLHETRAV